MQHRVIKVVLLAVLFGFGGARHASAQMDLSGIWAPIMHEDPVERPTFLTQDFVTSSHFRRELDGSTWNPAPCKP